MNYKLEDVKNMKFNYEYMLNIFESENNEETESFRKELRLMTRALDELLIKLKNEV